MSALTIEEVVAARHRNRKAEIVSEINSELINSTKNYVEIIVHNCDAIVSKMVQEEFQNKGWEINRQATSSNSYRFTFRM